MWRRDLGFSPTEIDTARIFFVACALGLMTGVASVVLDASMVSGVLIAALFMFAILKRAEIGVLGVLVATSTIVPVDLLPLVSIGVGSLSIVDLLLVALLLLIVVRRIAEPSFRLRHTPLDWPLIGFYVFALLATVVALLNAALEFKPAMKEARLITYYLVFFAVTNLVRNQAQQALLQRGLLILARVVAVVMIIQYLVGPSIVLLPGRVESLRTQGELFSGVTRILPPGQSLILVGFVVASMRLGLHPFGRASWYQLLDWALLGLSVMLTFNRVYWIGIAIAIAVAWYVARGENRRRLLARSFIVATVFIAFALWLSVDPQLRRNDLLNASLGRLTTLVSGTAASEDSLEFRYLEIDYALRQLAPPRLLGLGLGAYYRPFSVLDWEQFDGRGYLHNGHLWLLIKTGLIAYLCFVWLSIRALLRGLRRWRQIASTTQQPIVLGFALSFLIVLLGNMTSPMFMEWFWAPVVAVMLGSNELAFRDTQSGSVVYERVAA